MNQPTGRQKDRTIPRAMPLAWPKKPNTNENVKGSDLVTYKNWHFQAVDVSTAAV